MSEVLAVGTTFRDLVMAGLQRLPEPGQELHAESLHITCGGISNMARTAAALGLSTALCTPFGDDELSGQCRKELADWGIDLSSSPTFPGWRLPVTVSMSLAGDRAMVTVDPPPPASYIDNAPTGVPNIMLQLDELTWDVLPDWHRAGARVFADRGFDESGRWAEDVLHMLQYCFAFTPNELEAKAFAREEDVVKAARKLAERVGLVVVTRGAEGLLAVDSGSGKEVAVPAFPVTAVNTTGAGDATVAALVWAFEQPDLSLSQRLDLAALVGGAVVESCCGASRPPRVPELLERLGRLPQDDPQRERYRFFTDTPKLG